MKRIVEHDPNFMEEVDLIAGTRYEGTLSRLNATYRIITAHANTPSQYKNTISN